MYLSAKLTVAPTHTLFERLLPLFKGDENDDYIGGWDFPSATPPMRDPRFEELVSITGFKPDPGSPHFGLTRDGENIVLSISAAYWRKANQVHAWFVENVQGGVDDCNEFEVHPEALAGLVEACRATLANRSAAPALLPTRSGFFFGDTQYDEYYYEDLERTIAMLDAIKPLIVAGYKLYYMASW